MAEKRRYKDKERILGSQEVKEKPKIDNKTSKIKKIIGGLICATIIGNTYLATQYFKDTQDYTKPENQYEQDIVTEEKKSIDRPPITEHSTIDNIIKKFEPGKDLIIETQTKDKTQKTFETKKTIKINPYDPKTIDKAIDIIDYSSLDNLDSLLQDKVKERLKENILSSEWNIRTYSRIFTKLSKFDDLLINSKNYALIAQEIGPYLLMRERIPKSRAGASGWGQLMKQAKAESGLLSNHSIDESYHPIKGIKAAMRHHKKYGFHNTIPKLNEKLQVEIAVYNWGYGNVMRTLATNLDEIGINPKEIFRYSDNGVVLGIKDHESLNKANISYEDFSKYLPRETKNYIKNVNALATFRDNALEGTLKGINIHQQPLFTELFKERKLGAGNTLYRIWKEEAKNKEIPWDTFNKIINMHIYNPTTLMSNDMILVPKEEAKIPRGYFPIN